MKKLIFILTLIFFLPGVVWAGSSVRVQVGFTIPERPSSDKENFSLQPGQGIGISGVAQEGLLTKERKKMADGRQIIIKTTVPR